MLGILKSATLQSTCVVRAIKVTIPKLDVWEYVKADVHEAPAYLPDGRYELAFEGRRMKADKLAGSWRVSD